LLRERRPDCVVQCRHTNIFNILREEKPVKFVWATSFTVVLILCTAQHAAAGAKDGQGYFTAMATCIDDDEQAQVDDGVTGGQFGFGRALHELWNVEGYLMFASPDGSPGQHQTGLGGDLQFVFNRSSRFTPYLFVGAGYLTLDIDGGGDTDGLMLAGGAGR
jgi:hypothetical protein